MINDNGIYAIGLVSAHTQELGKRKDGTAYKVERITCTNMVKTWFVLNYSDDLADKPQLKFGDRIKLEIDGCRTDEKRNLYLSGPYTLIK